MRFLSFIALLAMVQVAQAELVQRTFCVFDPLGANGNLFGLTRDYRTQALEWGVDLTLRPYTDEKIASDEFKARQCDAVLLTGARARPFNNFAATVEAIGAVPSDDVMRHVVNTISAPRAARFMTEGRYEVAGVLPAGPIYLFVRDRTVNSVERLSGKRIATLDYDEPSKRLVSHVGGSIVPANSANFSGMFNNGSVDAAYAPALAYKPLEMYKGLANNGGILSYNLAYLDFQMVIHKDRFPEGFGQLSRTYVASIFDAVLDQVHRDKAEIDDKYWVELSQEDTDKYNLMLRDIRIALRDEGVYDSNMLRLIRRLRCNETPAAAECVEQLE
ncbi:MAG: hypothetical protein IBX52_04935 [Bacterioplanes sp.]|nr:hypothetical protein [Bacterioplanes sp.]